MSLIPHTGRSSSSTSSSSTPRLKLLVARDQSGHERVVYAEADKDAVDFLFRLLTMPIGTTMNRDRGDPREGCFGNLCESVETLPDRYFHADARAALLAMLRPTAGRIVLTGGSSSSSNPRSSTRHRGFVQELVTYTVTDDLKITPMSTISGITMLSTFGITDIRYLSEQNARLSENKGVKILKEAQESHMVLTNVFLRRRSSRRG